VSIQGKGKDYFHFDHDDKKRAKRNCLSFYKFKHKLSLQVRSNASENQYYKGDKNFGAVRQMSKDRCDTCKRKLESGPNAMPSWEDGTVTLQQFEEIRKKQTSTSTWFCGDLMKSKEGADLKKSSKHAIKCAVCGKNTNMKCGLCKVGPHDAGSRAENTRCFLNYQTIVDSLAFGRNRHHNNKGIFKETQSSN
jgi:hypothetical protein